MLLPSCATKRANARCAVFSVMQCDMRARARRARADSWCARGVHPRVALCSVEPTPRAFERSVAQFCFKKLHSNAFKRA
eukprot:8025461-Lingulodinium_polyedra.AAC.1